LVFQKALDSNGTSGFHKEKKLIDTDSTSVLQDLDLNFSGRFGHLDIGKEVSLSTNF
jgi:hypothetical protein